MRCAKSARAAVSRRYRGKYENDIAVFGVVVLAADAASGAEVVGVI